MKTLALMCTLSLFCGFADAQYNSLKDSDVLFKKRIVRSLELDNAFNRNIFGDDHSLVEVLIQAYERGEITGFRNDELKEILSYEEFNRRRQYITNENDTVEYGLNQLSVVEIGEDLKFDKHRSEIVFDMETLTIFIPDKVSQRGLLEPLISFSYDECVAVFKKDPRAYALNPLLDGRDINYSEVFLLRLFSSDIVKIGNQYYFDQLYSDPAKAYVARKHAENKLTEYLYRLYNSGETISQR